MKKLGFIPILIFFLNAFLSPSPYLEVAVYTAGNDETIEVSGDYYSYFPLVSKPLVGKFVSPSGSDTNPGTITLPWKTLRKAAETVKPGETVFVRGGIYREVVRFKTSGTETKPIVILAYPGETPIIEGNNTVPGEGGALLALDGDYIYSSGMEVRNSAYDGIQVMGNHDRVDGMFVHHNQKKGILISGGSYSVVENNRVWWNSSSNEYGKTDSWSSGITAGRGGVTHAVIRRNTVWENWGQGINTYESDFTKIEDNISHDNFAASIYIHDATNTLCQRNFVYSNPNSLMSPYGSQTGIMMGDERTFPSANVAIINNIAFGNNWNYALFKGTNVINNVLIANNTFVNGIKSGSVLLRGYHQNIQFENNIVQQDGDLPLIVIALDPDVSLSNNLWSKTPPSNVLRQGDVVANPLLKRAGDQFSPDWFMLTLSSPAINRARSLPEVKIDFFNRARNGFPDIGAFEYLP